MAEPNSSGKHSSSGGGAAEAKKMKQEKEYEANTDDEGDDKKVSPDVLKAAKLRVKAAEKAVAAAVKTLKFAARTVDVAKTELERLGQNLGESLTMQLALRTRESAIHQMRGAVADQWEARDQLQKLGGSLVDGNNATMCAICRNSLNVPSVEYEALPCTKNEKGLSVEIGICDHAFHSDCIARWLRTKSFCPMHNGGQWHCVQTKDITAD